jgi:hypothetical protein
MEPLWSPAVANGGNQRQIGEALNPRKQAKSVAIGCHRLPENIHGKEGVDGSSPEEGSDESPAHVGLSISRLVAFVPACSRMEQVLEQPDEEGPNFVVLLGNADDRSATSSMVRRG